METRTISLVTENGSVVDIQFSTNQEFTLDALDDYSFAYGVTFVGWDD